jgi:hypothetical protein
MDQIGFEVSVHIEELATSRVVIVVADKPEI